MIKNYSIHYFFLFIASLLLIPSCTEDDPIGGGGGGGGAIGPSSALISGTDLVTSSATIAPGGSFTVNLTASQGDVAMNSLTVQKDGVNIDGSSFTINGVAAPSGAVLIPAADQATLDYTMVITTDLTGGESATYSFIFADSDGLTTSESVLITAELSPPSLTASGGMDALMVPPGQKFTVNLTGAMGSSALSTLTIFENDVAIDSTRIEITGLTNVSNPIAIPAENEAGFDWEIFVKVADDLLNSTYRWVLEDASGEVAEVSRDIITGTPVDSIKTELSLFNQGGPAGTGGVNLITGASVGSDDADAHLQDAGIDLDLPAATNWMQQIGPGAATTTLKAITSVQPEGFSYDAVDTKEAIEAAFDLETNAIDDVTFSSVVATGDMFVLQAASGEFILVRVDNIEVITDGNSDRYILSAKF